MIVSMLQIIADFTLYFSIVGGVFSIIGELGPLYNYIFLFSAAAIACGLLRDKGNLRFIPAAVLIPAFFLAPSGAAVIMIIPAAFLVCFRAAKRTWYIDTVVVQSLIKAGLGLYLFVSLLMSFSARSEYFFAETIPLIMIWLGLSITDLRIERCSGQELTFEFYMMNFLLVAVFAAGGFILSSSWMKAAVKAVAGFIWGDFLAPLFLGAVFALAYFPAKLAEKLSLIVQQKADETPIELKMSMDELKEQYEILGQEETSDFAAKFFTALAILFFIIVAIFVLKHFASKGGSKKTEISNLTRQSIDGETPVYRRRFRLRKDKADQVRDVYRKYLQYCDAEQIPVDGTIASDIIKYRSEDTMGEEDTAKLRLLWLPARYSLKDSADEDVKEARTVLKNIKKTLAQRDKKLKGKTVK